MIESAITNVAAHHFNISASGKPFTGHAANPVAETCGILKPFKVQSISRIASVCQPRDQLDWSLFCVQPPHGWTVAPIASDAIGPYALGLPIQHPCPDQVLLVLFARKSRNYHEANHNKGLKRAGV
ncbi:MAG: hypothetical protein IPJ18_21890 [Betaproteobacteria bacterium]|nr:hypothetical protein [Betaproteobacteria bacterium]